MKTDRISVKQKFLGGVFCGAMALLTLSAQGTLIAYEGFDYTVGEGMANKSGGTGWSSNWFQARDYIVSSVSLNYQHGNVSMSNASGKAIKAPNVGVNHALSRGFDAGGEDIFISFLYQSSTPNDINSWYNQLWVVNGGDYDVDAPGAALRHDGHVRARSDGSETNVDPAVDTRDDQTHLIVVHLDWNGTEYSHVHVYANPDSALEPSGSVESRALTANSRPGEDLNFNRLGFRLNTFGGDTNSEVFFGEMRVGTTWDAVVIPEPTTTLLLLGGGFMLWGLRRRIEM